MITKALQGFDNIKFIFSPLPDNPNESFDTQLSDFVHQSSNYFNEVTVLHNNDIKSFTKFGKY
jgi:hypothetical protein